ncbi:MAG: NADP-dependent malic enzyme [bacterium]|nr:NADP-dependent malic enzyme [bacterium]
MDIREESLALHKKLKGKISLGVKTSITSRHDLSLAYTPGVAAVCQEIANDISKVWEYTSRGNWVAVVTDGTAVLGLGDIGPEAGLPVMEGKAVLFKEFAGVDAFPIALRTKDPEEIINIVKAIAPSFGGINLEDISAPRCFYIEERLKKELDIPVFHDDQHGTAIVVLAGLINALALTQRKFETTRFVISGAGAAGVAITKILLSQGAKDIVVLDSKGIVSVGRAGLTDIKQWLIQHTNPHHTEGDIADALTGADVFIGVSAPGTVSEDMIRSMNKNAIVFSLANPTPEIMPEVAKAGGARIIATGRSDYPNQVNNVLAFPGIFRGVLDARAPSITEEMKLVAARALARYVEKPDEEHIIPDCLDKGVVQIVADAVKSCIS